jgi:hypothetical protein
MREVDGERPPFYLYIYAGGAVYGSSFAAPALVSRMYVPAKDLPPRVGDPHRRDFDLPRARHSETLENQEGSSA